MSHNVRSAATSCREHVRLLKSHAPQPDVVALQEVWQWSRTTAQVYAEAGYDCVALALRPETTCQRGGCAILVNRHTTTACPIQLRPGIDSRMDMCAAFVGLTAVDTPHYIGVATLYFPPPNGQEPDAENALGRTIQELGEQGIELVVGDPNARHPTWCPALTQRTRLLGPEATAQNRGAQLYALTMTSDWAIVNDRTATRMPSAGRAGDPWSAPDVALAWSSLRVKFAVFAGDPPSGTAAAFTLADLATISDHLPIYLQVCGCMMAPFTLRSRCPMVTWRRIRDWAAVQATMHAQLVRDRPIRQRESAATHYGRLATAVKATIRTLPQNKRTLMTRPEPLPEALQRHRDETDRAIQQRSATMSQAIRAYRKALLRFREHEMLRKYNELSQRLHRGSDWALEIWRLYRAVEPQRGPGLVNAQGKPQSRRVQADRLSTTFAAKHAVSTTEATVRYANRLHERLAALLRERQVVSSSSKRTQWAYEPVTPLEVQKAVQGLRTNQAADPWGMKPILLQHMPPHMLTFVAQMFTAMMRDAFVPRAWRVAHVIPLYKGGDKEPKSPTSYRPIAITPLVCRVLEAIIVCRISHYMRTAEGTALHTRQFGFCKGVSADMLMLHLVSSLQEGDQCKMKWHTMNGIDLRYAALLVAVDFTDAYCRVLPAKVVYALYRKNVPGYICRWVAEYLRDRSLAVVVQGCFSPQRPCAVGVPQGSVLGPLLWNLAMDDLLYELEDFCKWSAKADLTNVNTVAPPGTPSCGRGPWQQTPNGDDPYGVCATYAGMRLQSGAAWVEPAASRRIYAAPICEFGAYADDLSVWVMGHSPKWAATFTQCMLTIIARWADENGIKVSTKTEARWIHGSNRVAALYPQEAVELTIGSAGAIHIPVAHQPQPPLRVLGLYIDPGLTFRPHAEQARDAVEALLKDVTQRLRLMPVAMMKIIVQATAQARLLSMLPIVWTAGSEGARHVLTTAWGLTCVAMTGAFATANRAAVILEAGHRPIAYEADSAILRIGARLWALHQRYAFLFQSVVDIANSGRPHDRLHRQRVRKGAREEVPLRRVVPAPPDDRQRREWPGYRSYPPARLAAAAQRTTFLTELTLDGVQLPKKEDMTQALQRRFNARQLDLSPAEVEVWTDGSVAEGVSGGAYLIVDDGVEVRQGTLSLGVHACSYSMERATVAAALQTAVQYLTERPARRSTVRLVTDSLSTLKVLEHGPLRQSEAETEVIWAAMTDLPTDQLYMVFVFSHTQDTTDPADMQDLNMIVDQRAESAQSSTPTVPPWPRDVLRPLECALQARYDTSEAVQSTLRYEVLRDGRPARDITQLRLVRTLQKALLQLRTGVSYELGGWRHEDASRCPHCGAAIGRLSSRAPGVQAAVYHLFACPRCPTTLTVRSLWTNVAAAMRHYTTFIGGWHARGDASEDNSGADDEDLESADDEGPDDESPLDTPHRR